MIASSRSSFLQHGVHNGVVIYARCTGLLCWSCVAVRCSVLVVLCCLFASDASQLHDLASSDRQKLCKDDVHNAMRALRRPCAAVGCCSPSGCTLLLSAPAWSTPRGKLGSQCWKRQWNPATCTHAPGSKGHTNTPQPSSTQCRTERNAKTRPPDRDGSTITGATSDATASRARRKSARANLASTTCLTNGLQAGAERLRQVKHRG